MTPAHTDESKDTLKRFEELWKKLKDLIRSVNNNSDDYDEKDMKIKFNWDDDLPLKKTLELLNIIVVVRSIFHDGNKYYTLVFLVEWLYKVAEYDIIVEIW